jgi:hypothetical protein
MAEAQQEMTSAELYDDTLSVLEKEFENIQEESAEEVVNAADSSESNEQPVTETPTYQEAEAAQQEPGNTEDDRSEASTETLSESPANETRPELDKEDADLYGNLKPKAQERFEHWINRAKELESQNQELSVSKELQDYILGSGTNPQQLNWSLDIFNNLNSGNYQKAVNALKSLDTFADQIGERLGVNTTNNENVSYSDFQDLSGAVENLEMSEEWANKLASQRVSENAQNQAQSDFTRMAEDHNNYQAAYNGAANNAYQQISQWENQIKHSDPDYALKSEAMQEVGRRLAQTQFPPQDWLPMLQNEYNVLSEGMKIAAQQNASKSSGPLAPGRNSGGVGSATMLDTAEVTPEFLQAHLDAMHNN